MEKLNNRDLLYKEAIVAPIEVIGILDDNFESDPLTIIHKIVNKYNKKLYQGIINKKIINGFYTVLCYEYNLTNGTTDSVSPVDFDKSFFINILRFITENDDKESGELIRLSYEIIVLQLKLYCDVPEINNLFKNFMDSQSKDSEIYYKIIECFIDALSLKHLSDDMEYQSVITEIKLWFKKIEKKDWKIFISLVIKMLKVFNQVSILPHLWEMILDYSNDWKKSLTLLNILVDYILVLSSEEILSLNSEYCSLETTWQLIFQGLMSSVEQDRKQGLYIMKKILDFLENHPSSSSKLIPFIRCPNYKKNPVIKELKSKFFLIMESLEEKQAHLVIPVLAHLERLIQFHSDHLYCSNCFASRWLQCIFERVLNHKTNGVIKSGLTTLLQMDPRIYNQDLIALLINSLNTTFIYDNQTSEPEPLVVKELSELFVKAEYSEVTFINEFIRQMAPVNWTPVPLFYVMSSLYKAGHMLNWPVKCNLWTEDQFNSLEIITDKFLNNQPLSLRNILRDFIASVIFQFAEEQISLESLARIYYSFSCDKGPLQTSESYSLLRKYMTEKLSSEAAINYIEGGNLSSEINIKSFAQMTAFLYDSDKIFKSWACPSLKKFSEIFNSLINIESRPYADKNDYLQVINLLNWFIYYLVKYCSTKDQELICFSFMPHIKSVLAFIVKQSVSEEIYFQCFRNVTKLIRSNRNYNQIFREYLNNINRDTLHIIDQNNEITNTKLLFALNIIRNCTEYLETPNPDGVKSMMRLCERPLNSENRTSEERRVTSDCYKLIAKISYLLISYSVDSTEEYEEILLSLLKLIDRGKESVIYSVMRLLTYLLTDRRTSLEKNIDVVKSLVETCWTNLWDMKRDNLFWKASQQFIECLRVMSNFDNLEVKEYVYKINSKSEEIPVLKCLLWNRLKSIDEEVVNYLDLIVKNFIDTKIGRDRKIEMQAHIFIFNNFDVQYYYDVNSYNFNGSNELRVYIDPIFRASVVSLIIHVFQCKYYRTSIIAKKDHIILLLLLTLKAQQNKKYYGDSHLHRVKHRVMQLLLVITAMHQLTEENLVKIHDTIGELIIVESNQPTVRMMQEWLLIKLYLGYPKILDKLWGLLERAKEERPGSITSIASIVYHVSKNIQVENKQLFIKDAISKLLSCSFSQQFVVRLYCQTVLAKLFEMIPSSLVCDYDWLKKSIDESLLQGNMYKNSMKLCEDFYFTKFDPIKNFTLATIFYDVPRLLNMSKDEWISPKIFKHFDSIYYFDGIYSIFINNEYRLENVMSSQMTKTRCQELDEEEMNCENSGDVQKKIMPWKSMIPLDEDLSGTLRRQKLSDDTGLIVVASLIDSMANLGGLARTAEIFCAKQLVLSSMKYVENKEFQILSVSAEKWVQITEVKAHELRDYLLEKSSLGWKIVGAEQTANSVCLTDVKFDKKTVLVLGNEKSGMPANLIPLMDVCIEIPQAGVVRSLNVHVTGAICMWQYAQQYIFS